MQSHAPKRKKSDRKIAISRWAHEGYYDLIERNGGEVVIVTEDTLLENFGKVAGLVIPGGRDVSPKFYGEKIQSRTQSPDNHRDRLEIAFVNEALKRDIPILGICRGHQVLNVAMGGTLIQHINGHVGHNHRVQIMNGTRHFGHIKNHDLKVNSLHHQAIKDLAPGLRIAAVGMEDNVIEAVEGKEHSFVVGVQWHPEMSPTPRFRREMDTLVKKFINSRK